MDIEDDETEPRADPDVDVDAFLAAAREKHRAYLASTPPRLPGVEPPCGRCGGSGRAPSPAGHVRCGECHGDGKSREAWQRVTITARPKPKRARKARTLPIIVNPGVKP